VNLSANCLAIIPQSDEISGLSIFGQQFHGSTGSSQIDEIRAQQQKSSCKNNRGELVGRSRTGTGSRFLCFGLREFATLHAVMDWDMA